MITILCGFVANTTGAPIKSHKEYVCHSDMVDDSFMRPPLWEDITSSIQNIDPENAIMLGSIATQVKLEATDDQFMEPLASPLLSPLEIKSEQKQPSVFV